jgi:hypothetical protein
MLPIVAIHGVCGTLSETSGYGRALSGAVDRALRGHIMDRPRVVEAGWAQVAQRHLSRDVIEAATIALAGLVGGPVAAGAVALLQRLGLAPLSVATDYAADVLLYERPEVRGEIVDAVVGVIEHEAPCVLVAHSLGSVIAVDALQARPDLARRVVGLVTLGSPLAVDVPLVPGPSYRDRAGRQVGRGRLVAEWLNIYDADDPIVDGTLWGAAPERPLGSLPGYREGGAVDVPVDTGDRVGSHVSYWTHLQVAQTAAALAIGPP